MNRIDQTISRPSIRLRNHDYSNPGIYYFTLVTFRREHILGNIEEGKMIMNKAGRILLDVWNEVPSRYPAVGLLEAVVMPNHFHGMIRIGRDININIDQEAKEIANFNVVAMPDGEVADFVDLEVAAIHELPLQGQTDLPLQGQTELPLQKGPPPQEIIAQIQEEYRISRRRMLLPKVVGFIKMNSAKRINQLLDSQGVPVWQRNYYERIIRNKAEFHATCKYIRNNPVQWVNNEENH